MTWIYNCCYCNKVRSLFFLGLTGWLACCSRLGGNGHWERLWNFSSSSQTYSPTRDSKGPPFNVHPHRPLLTHVSSLSQWSNPVSKEILDYRKVGHNNDMASNIIAGISISVGLCYLCKFFFGISKNSFINKFQNGKGILLYLLSIDPVLTHSSISVF